MQAYMYLLFSRHTALCNLSSEFVSKRKEIRQKLVQHVRTAALNIFMKSTSFCNYHTLSHSNGNCTIPILSYEKVKSFCMVTILCDDELQFYVLSAEDTVKPGSNEKIRKEFKLSYLQECQLLCIVIVKPRSNADKSPREFKLFKSARGSVTA